MLLPLQDLAADYPLFHARRFYPTLGRYPGHRVPFGPDLVGEPLGTSRNLVMSPSPVRGGLAPGFEDLRYSRLP